MGLRNRKLTENFLKNYLFGTLRHPTAFFPPRARLQLTWGQPTFLFRGPEKFGALATDRSLFEAKTMYQVRDHSPLVVHTCADFCVAWRCALCLCSRHITLIPVTPFSSPLPSPRCADCACHAGSYLIPPGAPGYPPPPGYGPPQGLSATACASSIATRFLLTRYLLRHSRYGWVSRLPWLSNVPCTVSRSRSAPDSYAEPSLLPCSLPVAHFSVCDSPAQPMHRAVISKRK